MKRFIEGGSRTQAVLFPDRLDDWIADDNSVRAIDVFVDELDLKALGFEGAEPAATGRPAYHPETLLKIYIYGYLNRLQSSRRLEREAQRNVEMMWLTERLAPDFKTMPISAEITVQPFARFASILCGCAATSGCSSKRSSQSTVASSRPSTTATRTLLHASSRLASSSWKQALSATLPNLIEPIATQCWCR